MGPLLERQPERRRSLGFALTRARERGERGLALSAATAEAFALLVDARGCSTAMTDADVEAAVAVVQDVGRQKQRRAHAAIVADNDRLYRWLLLYETQCAEIGMRLIRIFRGVDDAERWLEVVSAARELA